MRPNAEYVLYVVKHILDRHKLVHALLVDDEYSVKVTDRSDVHVDRITITLNVEICRRWWCIPSSMLLRPTITKSPVLWIAT